MSFKKNNPGCPCCDGSCDILLDSFERVDSDTVGGDYAEDTGDWDIDTNTLVLRSSVTSNNILRLTTTNPNDTAGPASPVANQLLEVKFKLANSSDDVVVIVNGEDASQSEFNGSHSDGRVEYDNGSGCARLSMGTSSGGVRTELDTDGAVLTFSQDNLPLSEWHTLRVCHVERDTEQDYISARLITSTGNHYQVSAEQDSLGNGVGLGTIVAPSSDIAFDDLVFREHRNEVIADKTTCPWCTDACAYFSDDFDRVNSTSLGCEWNNDGNFSIDSNNAKSTTLDSLAICEIPVQSYMSLDGTIDADLSQVAGGIAGIAFKGTTSGDKARVYFGIVGSSADDAVIAEATINAGSGVLKLFERVGGTETLLDEKTSQDIPTDEWQSLTICYDAESNIATAQWVSLVTPADSATAEAPATAKNYASSPKGAMGTGDTVAGTMRFDDFALRHHSDAGIHAARANCSDCFELANCKYGRFQNQEAPEFIKLTIAGMANDECTDCDTWNGTYILEKLSQSDEGLRCGTDGSGDPECCRWELEIGDGDNSAFTALFGCSPTFRRCIVVEMGQLAGSDYYIDVTLRGDQTNCFTGAQDESFTYSVTNATADLDPESFSVTVPFSGQNPDPGSCEPSGSTLTLSNI